MADNPAPPVDKKEQAKKFIEGIANELVTQAKGEFAATNAEIKTLYEKLSKEIDALKAAVPDDLAQAIEKTQAQIRSVTENIVKNANPQIRGADNLRDKLDIVTLLTAAGTQGKGKVRVKSKKGFGEYDEKLASETEEWEYIKQARQKGSNVVGSQSEGGIWIESVLWPQWIAPIYKRPAFIAMNGEGQTRVSILDGLDSPEIRMKKGKSGCVAYWGTEAGGVLAKGAPTGEEMNFKPHKLNLFTSQTREFLRFAPAQAKKLIQDDMTKTAWQELDRVIGYGKGGQNEPLGIANMPDIGKFWAENGTETAPGSPAGGKLDWTRLSQMDLAIAMADLDKDPSFATVSNPMWFQYLCNIRVLNYSGQAAADADYLAGLPPITQERLASLIGPFNSTTKVPLRTYGSDTNKFTDVFRGNFSEVLLARWDGFELVVDDNYDIVTDIRAMKILSYWDLNCRYGKALRYCKDARCAD